MRFQHTATEGIFVQIKCSKKTQTGKTVTAPWWPVNLKDLRVLLSNSGKYCKEYFLSTHDTPKSKIYCADAGYVFLFNYPPTTYPYEPPNTTLYCFINNSIKFALQIP